MSARKTLIASLALTGALFAAAAQARTDWSINIGLPFPGIVVAPQPRVVYPEPVYYPAPVYAPPPRVYHPGPAYYPGQAYHPGQSYHPGRAYYPAPRPVYHDRDHDGIPNRWDRRDNRHWDSDGDGVPNRYDRRDHNPRRW